ncbi:MAG: hypothetical protein JXX28_19785 [Deltaproteobacteria bacterium]|nr:hypothetical protein [Deltaproteobacteria bacterium]
MTLDELLAAIREGIEALEADRDWDVERLSLLADAARALGPEVPHHRQRELLGALESLMQAARGHRTRLDETMHRLRQGRRALGSYGHLRGHHRGQRQNRKV